MFPEELVAIATSVPVIAVLWYWNSHLQNQVRELREARDRMTAEYINHLKGQYNLAVEMELKKRFDDPTEQPSRRNTLTSD